MKVLMTDTVHIHRVESEQESEPFYVAEITGDAAQYVPIKYRRATSRSGHGALKNLAEMWSRIGFLD